MNLSYYSSIHIRSIKTEVKRERGARESFYSGIYSSTWIWAWFLIKTNSWKSVKDHQFLLSPRYLKLTNISIYIYTHTLIKSVEKYFI